MRILPILIAALTSTGCSGFVAGSGTDLSKLRNRNEVRAKFGTPVSAGSYNGEPFELYRTHRKIHYAYDYEIFKLIDTMYLAELLWLPRETFIAARQMIRGQELLVQYTESGWVEQITRDGQSMPSYQRGISDSLESKP